MTSPPLPKRKRRLFSRTKTGSAKRQAYPCINLLNKSVRLFCDNDPAVIITATRAYSVSRLQLAAILAARKIGSIYLPYRRASFIASCARYFSLRNRHCYPSSAQNKSNRGIMRPLLSNYNIIAHPARFVKGFLKKVCKTAFSFSLLRGERELLQRLVVVCAELPAGGF